MAPRTRDEREDLLAAELQAAFAAGAPVRINAALTALVPVIKETVSACCAHMVRCLPPGFSPDDALQEVWAKVRSSGGPSREAGRPAVSLRAWVKSTTARLLIDWRRRDRWLVREDDRAVGHALSDGRCARPAVENLVVTRDFLARLLAHLRSEYPPGARWVEVQQQHPAATPEELAALLATTAANVYQIARRTRQRAAEFRKKQG